MFGEVQKQIEMLEQADQLVFTRLIEEEVVEQLFEELAGQARHRIYTPHVTLAAFLGQAISDDGSCQQAVHRINKHRCSQGLPPASVDTNSYCEARTTQEKRRDSPVARTGGVVVEGTSRRVG
ncbi:MAG: hypothetical protein MUF25_14285 [Pirellulaceae bacterium]|nr:hypothetical protein [Pirellulaceae bacterium]